MATKNTESAADKKTRERGIDVEAVTAFINTIKTKSPENAKILSDRLAAYVDARDEKNRSRESLKAALKFLKG